MKNALLSPSIFFFLMNLLFSQEQHRVEIKKLSAEIQQTPQFLGTGPKDKRVTPRYWLELEAEVEVETTAKNEIIPELTANWFVVVLVKERGKEVSVLLTGECVFQSIRTADKKTHLSAYLDPDTMKRLTGKEKTSLADIEAIALTVSGPGVRRDGRYAKGLYKATAKESSKWWAGWKGKTESKVILAKSETPFEWLWIDRYPLEKSQK